MHVHKCEPSITDEVLLTMNDCDECTCKVSRCVPYVQFNSSIHSLIH